MRFCKFLEKCRSKNDKKYTLSRSAGVHRRVSLRHTQKISQPLRVKKSLAFDSHVRNIMYSKIKGAIGKILNIQSLNSEENKKDRTYGFLKNASVRIV